MTAITPPSSTPRLRRRLWKAGGLIALFIVTSLVANCFVSPDRAVTGAMIGHDFLVFYSAGGMARRGDFHSLYDLSAIKAAEVAAARSAGLTVGYGPWWNPPFAAWLFAPFSFLPFSRALELWQIAGLAMMIASALLLIRMLPRPADWQNWGLLCLLLLAANPFWAVIWHGQNTFLTLLLLCVVATVWRARRGMLAGLAAGLLLYKPQHAAVVSLALIASLGWPAAMGLALSAGGLICITIFTMPGALDDYLHKLPHLLAVMQDLGPYSWDRHVTLKAFWRLLIQGDAPGSTRRLTWFLWSASELAVAAWVAAAAWAARRDRAQTDRLIAVAIAAGPLLTPFCFDYDLLILAIPAVLCAAEALRSGRPMPRRLLWAWIVLYLFLHVSTPLAPMLRFVLATPALVAVVAFIAAPLPRLAAPLARRFPPAFPEPALSKVY